jgi:hypothetical protein
MDRYELERRVEDLREQHPEREEFVAAVKELSESLDEESREILGQVLLDRQPETGGFDVLNKRLEEGGWVKRSLGRMAERERKIREQ